MSSAFNLLLQAATQSAAQGRRQQGGSEPKRPRTSEQIQPVQWDINDPDCPIQGCSAIRDTLEQIDASDPKYKSRHRHLMRKHHKMMIPVKKMARNPGIIAKQRALTKGLRKLLHQEAKQKHLDTEKWWHQYVPRQATSQRKTTPLPIIRLLIFPPHDPIQGRPFQGATPIGYGCPHCDHVVYFGSDLAKISTVRTLMTTHIRESHPELHTGRVIWPDSRRSGQTAWHYGFPIDHHMASSAQGGGGRTQQIGSLKQG